MSIDTQNQQNFSKNNVVVNTIISSGPIFPKSYIIGDLFYLTDKLVDFEPGYYAFSEGDIWTRISIQGLHWVEPVEASSIENLLLSGLQDIDGVRTIMSTRILVQHQIRPLENGVYLVSSGAWSRAYDSNSVQKINNSAVYVKGGNTYINKTLIQSNLIKALGADQITYKIFVSPVVNSSGFGISLNTSGMISVNQGAGLTFDTSGALILDLESNGGLYLKPIEGLDSASVSKLSLTETGVLAGTYNSGTSIYPFTVDSFGRLTSIQEPIDISPSFSSLINTPKTLIGYGIIDALSISGGYLSGDLKIGMTVIRANIPEVNTAYFSSAKYSSVGDGMTHFGFNVGESFINYIRGSSSKFDGDVEIDGSLIISGSKVLVESSLTKLSQFQNDLGFINKDSVDRVFVLKTGDEMSGPLKLIGHPNLTDSLISISLPADENLYSYFKMSRGKDSWDFIIDKDNKFIIRSSTENKLSISSTGDINISGNISASNISKTSLGDTVVLRDSLGGISATNLNTSLNFTDSGITSILVKAGTDDIKSTDRNGLSKFLSGATFDILGNAASSTMSSDSMRFGNLTPASYFQVTTDLWHKSTDGFKRFCFDKGGRTYFSSNKGFEFRSNAGVTLGLLDDSGSLTILADLITFSDETLKTNIKIIDNPLAKVESLTGVTFTRTDTGKDSTGLIAQKVKEVLPEAVHIAEDGKLSVAYGNLAGLFVEAIKELSKEVSELKKQINELKKI